MDVFAWLGYQDQPLAVVPVLVGPIQALLTLLPIILVALGSLFVAMFRPSSIKKLLQLLWSQKLAVLGFVVVLVGLVYAWPAIFPNRGTAAAPAAFGNASWPLWRGTPARTGAVLDAEDPAQGGILWSFYREGIKTIYASPAVVGNRVYVTSARWELFKKDGAIYSIDADSGEPVWIYNAGGYRATFSSPAVSGKYLVVGEGLHQTEDARVFCLDVEASEAKREGVKLWEYRTRSHVESSPAIADGRAYVGAGDDGFYCFALVPEPDGKAKVLWHLSPEKYRDCETSPVVQDGKVYFGLGNGGQAVCCVDAATGQEIWRLPTPYPVFGSPSLVDGKLYVGMGNGDFVNTAEALGLKPGGEVWCIDAATGKALWRQPVGGTVLGAVAVEGERVYFGSRDNRFYCFTADGKPVGNWDAHAPILTAPAVGREYVYVVTAGGRLYALAKQTLTPVWEVPLNATDVLSSPSVARGHVYVGTGNAGLLCVGKPGTDKAGTKPMWAGFMGGPGKSGSVDGSPISARGDYAWGFTEFKPGADDQTPAPVITAPAAYLAGALYVGAAQDGWCGLVRLDAAANPADKPARAWGAPSTNPVYVSPAALEEAVFFADGKPGDAGRALRCLDPKTGTELWQAPVAPGAGGEFVITGERLMVSDAENGLTCLDIRTPRMKKELWRANVGACVGAPAFAGDNIVVVAVKTPAKLVALDLDAGAILWSHPLSSTPTIGPVFAGGRVWIGQDKGIEGFSLVKSEPSVAIQSGRPAGVLVGEGARIVLVNDASELVLVDAVHGKEIVRIPDAVGTFPPVLAGDAVLFQGKGAIQRYDIAAGTSAYWTRITPSWPGAVTSPLIMVDSHVFFATDRRGLVCMKPRQSATN